MFFFFHAEDGIRDHCVTGVQTCALPILEDFWRYMRHEAELQQLFNVVGASAKLLSPREAEILYRKEHEQASTEVVGFWATNYLEDRKSTRLNSSHTVISYAVFCLKKKNK